MATTHVTNVIWNDRAVQAVTGRLPQPKAPSVFLESCLLCGVLLCAHDLKRRRPAQKLKQLLQNCWQPTDFVWKRVYNVVHSVDDDTTIPMCMPCVHWSTRSTKRSHKSILPLDLFLMSAYSPGQVTQSDERIQRRLAVNLVCRARVVVQDKSNPLKARRVTLRNPYAHLLPESLEQQLRHLFSGRETGAVRRSSVAQVMLHNWWTNNACSLFVSNNRLAAQLRRSFGPLIETLYHEIMSTRGK